MAEDNRLHGGISPTLVIVILAVVLFGASCAYAYVREWVRVPELKARTLIGALREYRKSHSGRWPERLEELGKVPELGIGVGAGAEMGGSGKTLVAGNYLYVYTPYGEVVSLWAIPVGDQKERGSSHYIVFNAEAVGAHWVGPALTDEQLKYAEGDPGEARLVHLGMKKLPSPAAGGDDRQGGRGGAGGGEGKGEKARSEGGDAGVRRRG